MCGGEMRTVVWQGGAAALPQVRKDERSFHYPSAFEEARVNVRSRLASTLALLLRKFFLANGGKYV
jgi:hypothetical protein